MNFYELHIKPYADKIHEYFLSEEFFKLFASINGEYFTKRYFSDFLQLISGGKCIRAYLADFFYRAYGGDNPKISLVCAAAYELFESAVLMHDDVIDRSPLRRGKPSAYVALGNNHEGVSRAICMGDVGLLTASVMLENSFLTDTFDFYKNFNLNDLQKGRIFKAAGIQKQIFLTTVSGELADIDLAQKSDFSAQDVIDAYKEKTAHYTVIGPALAGATLSNATAKNIEPIKEFGMHLGVAFQIKDDILGIFNSSDKTGKSSLTDIAEGKKSLLLANYLSFAPNKTTLAKFFSIYGNENVQQVQAEFIKNEFLDSGALEKTTKQMDEYFSTAKDILKNLEIPESYKTELFNFIDYLYTRER